MKINCPACGHSMELSDAYDDYEGPVRCWVCRAVFEIRTQEGCIKMVREHSHAEPAAAVGARRRDEP